MYNSMKALPQIPYNILTYLAKNDEIIWMADPVLGKVDVKTMRSYIEKNYDAICTRNSNILNKIDKSQV